MIRDYLVIAYRNLKERKTRSILTLLGIFLAILTIFVLMSLSLGLNDFVNEQFEILGTDKFFVQPKGQLGPPGGGGAVELTIRDAEIIENTKGVNRIAYSTINNAKIEFRGKTRFYYVISLPLDSEDPIELFFETANLEMDEGRFLRKGDKKKVLAGYNYKHRGLFDKPLLAGDTLELNGVEFKVIGIVDEVGNPGDDQQLYISFEDFKELYDSGDTVDFIYAEVKLGEDLRVVANRAERKLMKFRGLDENTLDFTVQTPEELLGIFESVLNILTAFLFGIGAISLIVGGIGIANTMYTSVLERRKEIGTMKAVGAKNSDVLLIFVIEAGILGLIGGGLGLIFGIIVAKTVEYISAIYIGSNLLRASLNPLLVFGSIAFAFIIGVISGIAPSYQASKLKPVDALRYE